VTAAGLFRGLLGPQFDHLAPRVREVHAGRTLQLRGRATVTRGDALLGRIIGRLVSLPDAQSEAPTRIELVVDGGSETWTRRFGASRPMRSHLHAREHLLIERLGPLRLGFRLRAGDGAILWQLESVSFLGVPAPRNWFARATARSYEQQGRYCFEVDVALPLIGHLIGYRGSADVSD
jgi:hypothetical protein